MNLYRSWLDTSGKVEESRTVRMHARGEEDEEEEITLMEENKKSMQCSERAGKIIAESCEEGDVLLAEVEVGEGGEVGVDSFHVRSSEADDVAPIEAATVRAWGQRNPWCPHILIKWAAEFLGAVRRLMGWEGALGLAIYVFGIFSLRIVITPLWTCTFIPVLSPLYMQGPRWASSSLRSAAILCHVIAGVLMLLCAMCQFDHDFRKASFRRHRTIGYAYVVCGIVCLASLHPLKDELQQDHGIWGMTFIEVTTALWVYATAMAIRFARRRDFNNHKRWMMRSVVCGLSPAVQRICNFILLVPAALALRFAVSGSGGVSFISARWGNSTESISWYKLMASADSIESQMALIRSSHATNASEASRIVETTFPRVLSLAGYGIAQQLIFPLSSWMGLLVAGVMGDAVSGGALSSYASLSPLRHLSKSSTFLSRDSLSALTSATAGLIAAVWGFLWRDKLALVPEGLHCRRVLAIALHLVAPVVLPPLLLVASLLAMVFSLSCLILTSLVLPSLLVLSLPASEMLAAIVFSLPVYAIGVAARIAVKGESVQAMLQDEVGS